MLFTDYIKLSEKLTYQQRKNLPKSAFAFPERVTKDNPAGRGAYIINDIAHARDALARVSAFGTSAEKARVRAVVCRRYPDINSCKKKK